MMERVMKRQVWHIDALFALLMAVLFWMAYHFDGPRDPAIKPVVTKTDRSPCVDGLAPQNWICPEGTRL